MQVDIRDKIAIVTGAGTGIGTAIAELLAEAGANVVLVGRREERLNEVRDGMDVSRGLAVCCDVSDRTAVAAMIDQVRATYGAATILINNAGYNIQPRNTADISYDNWDMTLAINLTGAFNCVRAVLPGMRTAREGTIVNVSSIAGKVASVTAGAAYSASKHGMVSLATSINDEECRNGIRATVVCPGETETPILDQRAEPVSAQRRAEMLQPEDVAEAVMLAVRLPARASLREVIIKPRIAYL
jgi:NADP-dependent 3-hydroxy acid dehydrogenase YdfG